jgi:hypothetical protein
MTLEEANDAVGERLDELFDAIDGVLEMAPKDFLDALQKLYEAREAHTEALMLWGEMDDAEKK